ncbi:uncharacterized protein LOC128883375 isoform X2 [Hylaeus volcanicus]|uniref:uncharacterized protein LOC128883375 isoform X2 n=1 Tax=Hylaeus volcanicus TaxID=313075 RepID=UPI0023B7FDF0|nr:uncharacterized protein LOC128883375 isoform X2 [Hylaeus volcanicus]
MCTLDACLSQKKRFLDHVEHCLFHCSYNSCTLNNMYYLPPHENPEILHKLGQIFQPEENSESGTHVERSNHTRETDHTHQENEFHFIRQYAKYQETIPISTLYKVILHIVYELIQIDQPTTLILQKHERKLTYDILQKGIGLCRFYLNTSWSYLMGYSRRYFLVHLLQQLNSSDMHQHTTVEFNTTDENFGIGDQFYYLSDLVQNWVLKQTNNIPQSPHSCEQTALYRNQSNNLLIDSSVSKPNDKHVEKNGSDTITESFSKKKPTFSFQVTVEDIQSVLHDLFPNRSTEDNKILTKSSSQHDEHHQVSTAILKENFPIQGDPKKTFTGNEGIEGETEQFLYESVQAMISIAQRYGTLLNKDNKVLDAAAISTQSYILKTYDAVNNLKIFTWGNQLNFMTEIFLFLASLVVFCVIFPFIFSTIALA